MYRITADLINIEEADSELVETNRKSKISSSPLMPLNITFEPKGTPLKPMKPQLRSDSENLREHPTTDTSTASAEYTALCLALKEISFVRALQMQIDEREEPAVILEDINSSALNIANGTETSFSRFVLTKYFSIRQAVQNGEVIVKKVGTADQLADIMTKSLDKSKFLVLIRNFPLGCFDVAQRALEPYRAQFSRRRKPKIRKRIDKTFLKNCVDDFQDCKKQMIELNEEKKLREVVPAVILRLYSKFSMMKLVHKTFSSLGKLKTTGSSREKNDD